jgi:mevalonate kinase
MVSVRSYLPVGMGLGSSAAFSVSVTTALVFSWKIRACSPSCQQCNEMNPCKAQRDFINGWSFQAEKVMHGTPSGIDNSVSTFGGVLTLTKGTTMVMNHLQKYVLRNGSISKLATGRQHYSSC